MLDIWWALGCAPLPLQISGSLYLIWGLSISSKYVCISPLWSISVLIIDCCPASQLLNITITFFIFIFNLQILCGVFSHSLSFPQSLNTPQSSVNRRLSRYVFTINPGPCYPSLKVTNMTWICASPCNIHTDGLQMYAYISSSCADKFLLTLLGGHEHSCQVPCMVIKKKIIQKCLL